jgi:hypothetical protein
MADIKYQYRDITPAIDDINQVRQAIETLNHPCLEYSSPWPWILATGISLAMWASLGWILWIVLK